MCSSLNIFLADFPIDLFCCFLALSFEPFPLSSLLDLFDSLSLFSALSVSATVMEILKYKNNIDWHRPSTLLCMTVHLLCDLVFTS